MRAFAFPYVNPGHDMLITAPELIHLDPITKNVEDRLLSTRLSRDMLRSTNRNARGITHRPFEAKFRNDSTIMGRIPQKDGRGVKGCVVVENTYIATTDGQVLAEKLKIGDWVLTHRGNYRKILHIYRLKTETVEVSGTSHRNIVVSDNHKFYARRNSNPQRTRNLGQPHWMRVDDPELSRHYWSSPTQFPSKITLPEFPVPSCFSGKPGTDGRERIETPLSEVTLPLLMDLAGRYVADGYSTPHYVAFIDDEQGIRHIEGVTKMLGYAPYRHKHDNAVCVGIHNTELTRWLKSEFGALTAGKKIPGWLYGAPSILQGAFLDSYLQGDGSWVENRHRWQVSTASKSLAIGIKLLGQAAGYSASFSWFDPKVTHISGVKLKNVPQRSYRVQLREGGIGVVEDGMIWQKMGSVKPAGVREVFDLVVDDDFSYVADGLVHMGGNSFPSDDEKWTTI
jgi:intein/homing endonuclease